jgi:multiple sugar transport system ATP-binding protein
MAGIALRQIRKAYGSHAVIHGVDLDIADGEFLVLVGPSGCGKSTLLRMIAGLEEISGGEMKIGGKVVNMLSPAERNIAMVFQDYALYPHMTVGENMGFGLRMRKENAAEIDRRVGDAADTLKLRPLLERRPGQLSGGQRQRVAMGRAIVRDPQAFLFDEPLSNLDAGLRVEMRLEIAKLHRRIQATTVYVTHDQVEAMTLADRIVVMNAGRMEQVGPPLDLYHRPASLFVARFIGSPTMNTMTAPLRVNSAGVELGLGNASIAIPGLAAPPGLQVTIGIRAEDLAACDFADAWFSGQLAMVERLGGQTFGYLDTGAERLITVEFARGSTVRIGDTVSVKGAADMLHLFDGESGQRLN